MHKRKQICNKKYTKKLNLFGHVPSHNEKLGTGWEGAFF